MFSRYEKIGKDRFVGVAEMPEGSKLKIEGGHLAINLDSCDGIGIKVQTLMISKQAALKLHKILSEWKKSKKK